MKKLRHGNLEHWMLIKPDWGTHPWVFIIKDVSLGLVVLKLLLATSII